MTRKTSAKMVALLGFVPALAAMTWARKFTLTASSKVPSASGEIDTGTDKNGNTQVDIKVQNLAKPGNLTPAATTYVLWFQQHGAPPANEGELKVDNKLKGELKATTPWKSFDVFVTAETDPLVKNPSSETVLRTRVQT